MARRITIILLLGLGIASVGVTALNAVQRYNLICTQFFDDGQQDASIGARLSQHVIEKALVNGNFDVDTLFGERYESIPDSQPARFITRYSRYLERHLRDQLNAFTEADVVYYAYLARCDGFVVMHTDRALDGTFITPPQTRSSDRTSAITTPHEIVRGPQGFEYYQFSVPVIVRHQHWGDFHVGIPLALIRNETRGQVATLLTTMLVCSFLLASLVYVVVRRQLRPLSDLATATHRMASGDLSVRCSIAGYDEVGISMRAFNEMADAIEERESELTQQNRVLEQEVAGRLQAEDELSKHRDHLSELVEARTAALSVANEELEQTNSELENQVAERLRAEAALQLTQFAIDQAPDAAFWIDVQGRISYVNNSVCRMLGYSREELLGKDIRATELAFPGLVMPEAWGELPEDAQRFETNIRQRHGRELPVEVTVNLLEYSRERYVCVFMHDITQRVRQNEELAKFQRFAQTSGQGFGMVDFDKKVLFANCTLARLLGEDGVATGEDAEQYYTSESQRILRDEMLPALEQGQQWTGQLELCGRDEVITPTIQNWFTIADDHGSPSCMAVVVTDITESKRSEEALRLSESKFRSLVDNIGVGIVEISPDYRMVFRNRQMREWFPSEGQDDEPCYVRLRGKRCQTGPCSHCPVKRTFEDGQVHEAINEDLVDGQMKHLRLVSSPIRDNDGNIISVIEIVDDITQQQTAEEQLRRQAEELAERIKKLKCVHGVSALLEQPGISVDDILNQTVELIRPAWQYPEITSARILLQGKTYATANFQEALWKMSHPILVDGALVGAIEVCYLEERPERDAGPFLREERLLLEDIAERLGRIVEKNMAEAQVKALKHQIEFILGATKTGLDIVDSHGMLCYVDPETARTRGEWQGRSYNDYFSDRIASQDERGLEKALRTNRVVVTEVTTPDAPDCLSQVTSMPFVSENGQTHVAQVTVDISERIRMEVELAQAQKMESIGQLAAGIAHEINTPTQYIGDNVRFLEDAFQDIDEVLGAYHRLLDAAKHDSVDKTLLDAVDKALEEADLKYLAEEAPNAIKQSLDGIDRVASIVRAMKEFSHPGAEERQALDLNHSLETTLTISRNEWKYVADVQTEFDPEVPPVLCYPGDLNQAFLNVIVNAAHAVGESIPPGAQEKGMITIRTRRDGDWAQVEIEDTGGGIPDEIASRIFDPFFTTKDVGQGTGQGLAIVHAVIVEKHRGTVSFHGREGGGTCFVIRLPL